MATTDTKKILEQDFTQQPQAMTQEDVNNQDARTRLWQSLDYSYGNQIRESDKSYDRAIAEADRRALARGMQRSSYNNQVLANMSGQKIEAQNNIRAGQIADYQNRIGELEQQEEDKRRWEIQQAFNEKQFEAQQAQWREEFDYNKMSDAQKIAFEVITRAIELGNDVDDATLERAGISRSEFSAMKTQNNQTAGAVTWRQTEDAAAKAAGFTNRNDPAWIAYKSGQATTTGATSTGTNSSYDEWTNNYFGEPKQSTQEEKVVGTKIKYNYGKNLLTPAIAVNLTDTEAKKINNRGK